MQKSDVKEWDIVIIDYVEEFTKAHINEGFAIVLWVESSQPLVVKLDDLEKGIYAPKWYSYSELSEVVGRYDFGSKMLEIMKPYKRNMKICSDVNCAVCKKLLRRGHYVLRYYGDVEGEMLKGICDGCSKFI